MPNDSVKESYVTIMTERYGQRYTEYREAYESKDVNNVLDFPLQIDLDLIDSCNLECPGCLAAGRRRNNKSMSKKIVQQIIHECNEHNMPAINIGVCAEPLLNMDLTCYSLAEIAQTSIMDVFLHTNGLLLNEANSSLLIEGGVTYLCVSIDAASQEVYQQMRNANINTLIENIEKFLTMRKGKLPILRVSFLATAENIHEKDIFMDYWKDRADVVDFQNYIKTYDIQPDIGLSEKLTDNTPIDVYRKKKRMAIVAPEYLCVACGGIDVEESEKEGNTLSKYGTIKNYWDRYVLSER